MSDFEPTCPKCQRVMEAGVIPDAAHGGRLLPEEWQDQMPQEAVFLGLSWTGLRRGKKRFPVTVYRCPNCGYLESYAP